MKMWLRMSLLSAFLAVATTVHAAGSTTNTTITQISLNSSFGDFIWIQTATAPTGSPTCAASPWNFTLSLDTTIGKNQYAVLLSALATGQTVILVGTGACSDWGNVESLQNVVLMGS